MSGPEEHEYLSGPPPYEPDPEDDETAEYCPDTDEAFWADVNAEMDDEA